MFGSMRIFILCYMFLRTYACWCWCLTISRKTALSMRFVMTERHFDATVGTALVVVLFQQSAHNCIKLSAILLTQRYYKFPWQFCFAWSRHAHACEASNRMITCLHGACSTCNTQLSSLHAQLRDATSKELASSMSGSALPPLYELPWSFRNPRGNGTWRRARRDIHGIRDWVPKTTGLHYSSTNQVRDWSASIPLASWRDPHAARMYAALLTKYVQLTDRCNHQPLLHLGSFLATALMHASDCIIHACS